MTSVPVALKQAIEQHHSATNEFLNGNVMPWKEMCSHRDDVTIIGGWGGYERGWIEQVEKRYERPAARVRLSGKEGVVPMALRVTTIYRLEDGQWKVVHRHADPLLTVQGAASVIQKG